MSQNEKSKIVLKCRLSKRAYIPGEHLTGEVHLDVKQAVTFTGLKLHVLGQEQISGLVLSTLTLPVSKNLLTYLNHWIVFTSSSSVDGRATEALTYNPGCYTFPFSIPLPVSLPPSFMAVNSGSYIQLRYTATGIFEISVGHDVTSEVTFRIQSVLPVRQLAEQASSQTHREAHACVYRHSFLGCVYGERPNECVRLTAQMHPRFVCLGKPDTSSTTARTAAPSSSDKTTVKLLLTVGNDTKKPLRDVQVYLRRVWYVHHKLHQCCEWVPVASAHLRRVGIAPGETRELCLEFHLRLQDYDRERVQVTDGVPGALPSFSTPFITCNYVVVVNFPRDKVERDIAFPGLLHVAETTSHVHDAVRIPHRYIPANLATETPYYTYPQEFGLLEGEGFTEEPHPYLPRPPEDLCVPCEELTGTSTASSEVESAWPKSDGETRATLEGAGSSGQMMTGTPIPGRIIRAQELLSPLVGFCSVFESFKKHRRRKPSGYSMRATSG